MSIARHTMYNALGAFAPLAVTILATPFYLQAIGVERYGVLAIFWTILSSLGFLALGMGPAVAQRLAAMKGERPGEASDIVWTALALSLMAAIFGSVVIALIGHSYFSKFAVVTVGLQSEIRLALPLLAAGFPLILMNSVLSGTMQGRQRFGLLNIIQVTTTVLSSLVPLGIAYRVSVQLPALAFGIVSVNLAGLLAQFAACARIAPLGRPRIAESKVLRGLIHFGSWTTVSELVGTALTIWDRFVIGAMFGAAAVAIYSVPYTLVSYILVLPAALASATLPKAASMQPLEVDRLTLDSVKALNFVITPAIFLAALVVEPFLHLWLGAELARPMAPVALILLAGIWMNGLARVPAMKLAAIGKPQLLAKLHLVELPPYLLILYLCLREFGVAGAALAWSIRSTIDGAVVFAFSRSWRTFAGGLVTKMLLLLIIIAATLLLPMESALRWALTTSLVFLALLLVWYERPENLTSSVHWLLLRRLVPFDRGS